jgi:response regulator of citrate/malate metabolism
MTGADPQKLRCLLIDADVNALRELSRVVINNPHLELVNTCKTGRAAVHLLKDTKVDIILINPALPDANGFDLNGFTSGCTDCGDYFRPARLRLLCLPH